MDEQTPDAKIALMAANVEVRHESALLRRAKRDAPFFLVAAAVIAFDQLTKAIIRAELALGESWPNEDWLVRIRHLSNTGAAFGVLQDAGVFLTFTAVIAIGAIVFYYLYPPFENGLMRAALGLLLGGAVGNLIDRLRFGEVTDFIQFPRYPAFNVADSSITIGLAVIIGFFVLIEGREKKQPDPGHPAGDAPEPRQAAANGD
jgi:signal peptidase II